MEITVNREELIRQLECVQPGLSRKAIQDQSNCFVFEKGMVFTFNDDVACSAKTNFPKSFTGAVQADILLPMLTKLPEESLKITATKDLFIIKSKGKRRRKASIKLEGENLLSLDVVETPKKWVPLKAMFSEALDLVCQCTAKSESIFCLSCVHVTPTGLEATDTFQLCRFRMKMRIKEPFLLKQNSIKNIVPLGMTEFSETKSWVHFRNETGLVFSCRRYVDEYPAIGPNLKAKGTPVQLPKGLPEAVERAEICSRENGKDDNLVLVEISKGNPKFPKGLLRIIGQGERGRFEELKPVTYKGKTIPFFITPKLLSDLSKNYTTCEINHEVIKVVAGRFTYVACLTPTDHDDFAVTTKSKKEEETQEDE